MVATLIPLGGILWLLGNEAMASESESKNVAENVPGLVDEKPNEGRYVETDRGYMVPYTQTIPGSDVQFEMVPIPGGTVTLGTPANEADRDEDEGPQFQVTLEPFWLGKYEVTWAEYKYFMGMYDLFKKFQSEGVRTVDEENRVHAITAPTPLYDPSFTFLLGEEDRQPAVTMSHYAARQYTKWLSLLTRQVYRLPSEAEWEHACRAGTTTMFSFGDNPDDVDDYGWHYGNSDEMYHPVGEKKPNPWGLYDMHGSVAELVLDQYRPDAYQRFQGKAVKGLDSVLWTTKMFPHVVRGGSYYSDVRELRSGDRAETEDWRLEDPNLPRSPWWFTDEPALSVGFRILRTLDRPDEEMLSKFWDTDNKLLSQAVQDRLAEGRGVLGLVDPELPDAQNSEE